MVIAPQSELGNTFPEARSEQLGRLLTEAIRLILPSGTKIADIVGIRKKLGKAAGKMTRVGDYVPSPKKLKAFPKLIEVKKKTKIRGTNKLRKRWKDAKGNIYEWDYRHGTLEKYNKRG